LGLDTKRSEDDQVYVYAPKDVRDYKPLPNPGETPEETKLAELAWKAILDNAGLWSEGAGFWFRRPQRLLTFR